MRSAVVNQGAETLLKESKNHDQGVLHEHEKHGSNH